MGNPEESLGRAQAEYCPGVKFHFHECLNPKTESPCINTSHYTFCRDDQLEPERFSMMLMLKHLGLPM